MGCNIPCAGMFSTSNQSLMRLYGLVGEGQLTLNTAIYHQLSGFLTN